ncbi:MAG TPA: DUF5668 domain-containing protein [Candidatus Eisenbacteria bacterium]
MRPARMLVWGFFLIALGGAFLLERLGWFEMPNLGRMWPVVFAVIATINIAEGRLGSALTFLMLCAWFFACEFGWYGLDYHNSWPLVLVAVGAGIVVRALRGEPRWGVREGGES